MSWNKQRSADRIQQHLRGMQPINVSDLTKSMDLEHIVSENQCKRIFGVHVYAPLTRFAQLASSPPEGNSYKDWIIALHLYQQEVFHIVEQVFGGYFVHFQSAKLHALLYQPFRDPSVLAARAVLLQCVLGDFVRAVFHPVFPHYGKTMLASGADLGTTIATSNGLSNDRELLFIGSAANYAAKIIDPCDEYPRITQKLYQALPKELQNLCHPAGILLDKPLYVLRLSEPGLLAKLLHVYDIKWRPKDRIQHLLKEKRRLSLASITTHVEAPLTDLKDLSIFNNRRVFAASLFADISGFTRYIAKAEKNGTQAQALRVLHAIREEMACIVRQDFSGFRVQFQGDRVQALFIGKEQKVAQRALQAAIGLQSSMEGPIKECLPQASSLHLAIGIDLGWTLVSRLGVRKYRDPICIGAAVERAAVFEEASEGGQIAISRRLYQALPMDLRRHFKRNKKAQCYMV
ncbi:MAG TPA: adenylate/guanylate cyclase domain-containing protein, partial [Ktedonobacteraceae bacterium]|nr:adenylate/guanylate cyclase domain-containing protein [Ktedonobacteraceae bacterium]